MALSDVRLIEGLLVALLIGVVAVCAWLDGERWWGRVFIAVAMVFALYVLLRWAR